MGTQHTAYRQTRSVFGIASIPNINFGSITSNKFNICSHWLESVWKHNAQHIADLGQHWDCINAKYWTVFEISLIPNTVDLVDSDSSEMRSKLRLKLTGFEIEIGLTEIVDRKLETKCLVFQLVVDHSSN